MKVPDYAYDIPFCVVAEDRRGNVTVTQVSTPEEMHALFEDMPPQAPAYALNFGSIIREQNV